MTGVWKACVLTRVFSQPTANAHSLHLGCRCAAKGSRRQLTLPTGIRVPALADIFAGFGLESRA